MHKKIIPIVVLLAMIAGAVYFFTRSANQSEHRLGGSGTIEGTVAEVTTKIAGQILKIHADEGQRVTADQLLVELSHDELDKQLDQVNAAIETAGAMIDAAKDQQKLALAQQKNAKAEYQRAKKLFQSGSISKRTLDAATTARDSIDAQVEAAGSQIKAAQAQQKQAQAQAGFVKSQIANATLFAPIDGIVLTKNLEAGENAFPGSSILTLADDRNLWVKVYITGAMLGRVKIGLKAKVFIDTFPDKNFPGQVTYVSPVAEFTPKNVQTQEERVRLVYGVKVKVDGSGGELKIGMPADVELVE